MDKQPTVMIVSAEFWPLAKTGGLGDMVRSIATSLRDKDFQVRVLLPGYRSALEALTSAGESKGRLLALGQEIELLSYHLDGIEVIVVRCDPLFDRPGNIYLDNFRKPWDDNAKRFGVLCHVAASIVNGVTDIPSPDIVHLLDWHAALTPAYIDEGIKVPTVLTVQNFMFQGRFAKDVISDLELENRPEILEAAEFFSGFGFLQVGLRLSSVLTTASEGYIEDIKRRDRYSWYYLWKADLERLVSVKNWPETAVWSPATDPVIAVNYDTETLGHRLANRKALERKLGWAESNEPILFTLSRITRAKGFKFLYKQVEKLLDRGCRIVFLGEGERPIVNSASNLAKMYPGRVALVTPYREDEARQVLGGADILLMPSLTEPCGLSQQHAQIYGCVPIVSNAGGLRDTVTHGQTGFLFEPSNQQSFFEAVDAALREMRGPNWSGIQKNCMQLHVHHADRQAYADLFLATIEGRKGSLRLLASSH